MSAANRARCPPSFERHRLKIPIGHTTQEALRSQRDVLAGRDQRETHEE